MVAAFDYCLHGRGGAAPSIDTAMHGLIDAAHVDHLHPDSGIALATAADGEALTRRCFGDRVAWVDWRRPGFQLGLDMAEIRRDHPEAIGAILGGHGITAWGDTSEECEARSLEIIRTAERFIAENGRPEPFGAPIAGLRAAPRGGAPRPRGRAPAARPRARLDRPAAGRPLHRQRCRPRLRRPRRASAPGGARHVVPRPLPADEGPTDGPRPAADRDARRRRRAAARAARGLPRRLPRLLRAPRHARQPADARRRSGDRARAGHRHVLVRGQQADGAGRRRVLRQRDQRHARRRGAVDLRADRRSGEVPDRVLGARGGQAGADAEAEAARRTGRVRDRRRLGDRQGDRPPARRRGRLRRRRRHRCRQRGDRRARARRDRTPRSASSPTSPTRRRSSTRSARPSSPSAASTWSSTTPACRSRSRCSRRRSATGTSSTTSWPAARSSSRARRRGS